MMNQNRILQTVDQLLTASLRSERKVQNEGPTKKVIVLSFDALSGEDWSILKQYPNFNKLIAQGSYSTAVKSVYPSLTYPAHASVLTGKLPRKHGITSNTKLQPTRKTPDWYWHHKDIRCKTLFTEAKKQQMRVASIFWPVSAGAPIGYNMPEIFPNRPWHNQISISLLSGSKRYQLQMNERYGQLRKGLKQPFLDDYAHASALDTFATYLPDLMLVHYTDLDTQKHHHGASSLEAKDAIKRLDQRIGDYFKLLKQTGKESEVSLILFGDHSSRDVHTAIRPNVILQKEGFLSVEDNGKLHHCDYVFKTCDGSAYLYHDNLHRVSKEVLNQELDIIYDALEKHNLDFSGIKDIRTGSEAGYEGADSHALLMLEAEEGFYFLEDYEGELVEAVPEALVGTDHWLKATHGYHPDTEKYESVCFAFGSRFEKGDLGPMSILDLGPSIAHLLGMSLGETDGRIIWK